MIVGYKIYLLIFIFRLPVYFESFENTKKISSITQITLIHNNGCCLKRNFNSYRKYYVK